jgi:hemerythrin superfamily protein
MPDAIVLLKTDHKAVDKLFKQFEKLGDDATVTKRKLVDQILDELAVHAAIEEQYFYPAIRQSVTDVKDEVLEGYEEHHLLEVAMGELRGLDATAESFDAKVKVLSEMVRHHVEEEEQEMFPKVREALGRKELSAIGDILEQAKAVDPYPAGDIPATPRTSDRS